MRGPCAGCLCGVINTSTADLTFTGPSGEVFGYSVEGRLYADNDVQPDVAIGAPFEDTVYVHTALPAPGTIDVDNVDFYSNSAGDVYHNTDRYDGLGSATSFSCAAGTCTGL